MSRGAMEEMKDEDEDEDEDEDVDDEEDAEGPPFCCFALSAAAICSSLILLRMASILAGGEGCGGGKSVS